MRGRIEGIDETCLAVQQTVHKLDRLDLLNKVAFIAGSIHRRIRKNIPSTEILFRVC